MITQLNQKPKLISLFRPMILSRHPTHGVLRASNKTLPLNRFQSVIRLGSTTELNDTITKGGKRIEINTVEAIKNSASKLRMKNCFQRDNVKTADWGIATNARLTDDNSGIVWSQPGLDDYTIKFPIVAKHIFGSRGRGNYLIQNSSEFHKWLMGKELSNYIYERFYNYNREYRLHVTEDGCFYTCRKMLKTDTPEDKKWFRNDSNSNWWVESNEGFDKPVNWEKIEAECVKALKSVGLDFGAVDLRVQSSKNRDGNMRPDPDFIVIEINSAPSFGEGTAKRYQEILPQLLTKKYNQYVI